VLAASITWKANRADMQSSNTHTNSAGHPEDRAETRENPAKSIKLSRRNET